MDEEVPSFLPDRRQTMRQVALAVLVVVLVPAGGGVAYWLWPTAAKTLEEHRPLIERRHAQYCAVFGQLDGVDPAAHPLDTPPPDALRLPGFHYLADGGLSSPDPGENADGVEMGTLRRLCAGGARTRTVAFNSLFDRVDVLGTPTADAYDLTAVELALETVRSLEWLVVLAPNLVRDSRLVGEETFQAGEMSGHVWVCPLEAGPCLGAVSVRSSGPGVATAFGSGAGAARLAVSAETHLAFRRATLLALRGAGVEIEQAGL